MRADLVVNEGAGAIVDFDGRRVYTVCVAEKGVFRFTRHHRGAGRPRVAAAPRPTTRSPSSRPVLSALRERRPSFTESPEAEALLASLGLDPSDLEGAFARIEATDPASPTSSSRCSASR